MSSANNSRRKFLTTMALLTSGTVLAGSPLGLLEKDEAAALQDQWRRFVKTFSGTPLSGFDGELPFAPLRPQGHVYSTGEIIHLRGKNLLAVPTWISWGSSSRPNDILVTFFENEYPFKKIKTIHRFELDALVKLAHQQREVDMLQSICAPPRETANRLLAQTFVKRHKKVQDISLYNNGHLITTEKLFYNT